MRIQVLYNPGCPNAEPTVELVRGVAAALGFQVELETVEISNTIEAKQFSFPGSPTVRIDDIDIEPGPVSAQGVLGCRLYGTSGVPPREMVEVALRSAASEP